MLVTLSQLKTKARQRADMEDQGNFVSDSELTAYINEGVADLYALIIDADDGKLFTKNAPILPQVGDNALQLPDPFYRMVSVHCYRGSDYEPALPADTSEYAELADGNIAGHTPRYYLHWDLRSGKKYLFLFPLDKPEHVAVRYIPFPPLLDADSDTIDGFVQWDEYIALAAAIRMLDKQEQDTTMLLLRHKRLGERIEDEVQDFDLSQPSVIRELAHKVR